MKTVILRDDDTSAFTSPRQLESIYGRLWDKGKPVALAVVPAARSDVKILRRSGTPYDPAIPTKERGNEAPHPITKNQALLDFLNPKIEAGLVEICLHGYEHSYMEFMTRDTEQLDMMLTEGKKLLQEAFPVAEIKSFVAPYDRFSPEAFAAIVNAGYNFSTSSEMLAMLPKYKHISTYRREPLPGEGQRLYTVDDYCFMYNRLPAQSLKLARERLAAEKVFILVNHYWAFFYDWRMKADMLTMRYWHDFVDDLLKRDDLRFTTFGQG